MLSGTEALMWPSVLRTPLLLGEETQSTNLFSLDLTWTRFRHHWVRVGWGGSGGGDGGYGAGCRCVQREIWRWRGHPWISHPESGSIPLITSVLMRTASLPEITALRQIGKVIAMRHARSLSLSCRHLNGAGTLITGQLWGWYQRRSVQKNAN